MAVVERSSFVSQRDYRPSRLPSSESSTEESKALDKVKAWAAKAKVCIRCNLRYLNGDLLIARECSIHIGKKMYNRDKIPYYSCCKRGMNSRGCVSCMHVSTKKAEEHMLKMFEQAVVQIPKRYIDDGHIKCSRELIKNRFGDPSVLRSNKNSDELFYSFTMIAL